MRATADCSQVPSPSSVATREAEGDKPPCRELLGRGPTIHAIPSSVGRAPNKAEPVKPPSFTKARRVLTTIAFVLAVVWNAASPLKTWALTRFDELEHSPFETQSINWTAPLDAVFTTKLYSQAGIPLDKPDAPKRFINVFLDFMIRARSTAWFRQLTLPLTTDEPIAIAGNGAPVVDYSMAMAYCRLRMKKTATVSINDMEAALQTMHAPTPWNYFDDGDDCAIPAVPEALLCVAGQNVSTFIQQQMPYPQQFSKFDAEDVQLWQDTVFPKLAQCLSRRETLFQSLSSDFLQTLVNEIGRNYSLRTTGRGATKLLYHEIEDFHGFLDLSGQLSGYRVSQLSGQIVDVTTLTSPTSVDVAYKAFDDCFKIEIKAFRAKRQTVVDRNAVQSCIHSRARVFSSVYIGSLASSNDTMIREYVEDYQLEASTVEAASGSTVTIHKHNGMLNSDSDLEDFEYVNESSLMYSDVERGYTMGVLARYVENRFQQKEGAFLEVSSYMCIASDDCVDHCGIDTSGAWTMAFKISGHCVWKSISQDLMNRFGYVDVGCLGLGGGTSTIRMNFVPQDFPLLVTLNISYVDIPNTADASSIIACVLGGRKPKPGQRLPTYFHDTLRSGTGSVLVSVFSGGSERVLLSYIGLISLLGCALYSMLYIFEISSVSQFIFNSTRGAKKYAVRRQLKLGMMQASFASRVWLRHRRIMVMPAFMSIMLWQLVASQAHCSWVIPDPGFSVASTPVYQCDAGSAVSPWNSLREIIRLALYSYVFYLLVFHSQVRGCTRYCLGVLCCGIFFGFVPMYSSYVIIIFLNQWRLHGGPLYRVHTMLFLGMLWFLAIVLWVGLRKIYFQLVFKAVFKPLGFDMQAIAPTSAVESILNAPAVIGHAHLSESMLKDKSQRQSLPFSLLLESCDASLADIAVDTQTYSVALDQFADSKKEASTPDWVKENPLMHLR